MKQTAVNYLQDEILKDRMIKAKSIKEWNDVISKAREMEKQQIIDAHKDGAMFEMDADKIANEYYNKTYSLEISQKSNNTLQWKGETTKGNPQ